MDVHRYTPAGKLDKTLNISAAAADKIYTAHLPMVITPFTRYYRVVLVDPLAGGRIVRDTDHEVWGRQTIAPRPSGHTPLLIDWEGI